MNKTLFLISPLMLLAYAVQAQPGGDAPRPESSLVQAPALDASHLVDTLVGLVAVLALMLALAWLVKRFGRLPGGGTGQVKVLGGVSLGPRERAVLVSVEGQRLLLGVAPGRVQALHVLGEPSRSGQTEAAFAEQLEQASQESIT